MKNAVATKFRESGKIAKKGWLYGQDADVATAAAVPGWNEGYVASNKFLYFSDGVSAAPEKEVRKTNWLKK